VGEPGPTGPTGVTGPQGPTGPTGECACGACLDFNYQSNGAFVNAIDPGTQEIAEEFPLNGTAFGTQTVAVDNARGRLYIANGANGLTVMDARTGDIIDEIPTGGLTCIAALYNPMADKVYAFLQGGIVAIYSAAALTLLDEVYAAYSISAAVDPVGNQVLAQNSLNTVIYFISGASDQIEYTLSSFDTGSNTRFAVDPLRRRLYTITLSENVIRIFDLDTKAEVGDYGIPGEETMQIYSTIAANPATGTVYLFGNTGGVGQVNMYAASGEDLDTLAFQRAVTGLYAGGLVTVDTVHNLLYFSDVVLGHQVAVDGATGEIVGQPVYDYPVTPANCVPANIGPTGPTGPVGPSPCEISRVYTIDGSNRAGVITTNDNRISDTIPLSSAVTAVAGNQNTGAVYFAGVNMIYGIDGRTGAALLSIPVAGAQHLAVDPCRNLLYSSGNGGEVTVIDCTTNEVIGIVGGFTGAGDIVFGPCANRLYVTDDGGVKVVSGASRRIIASLPVSAPAFMALNPNTGRLYVVSNLSGLDVFNTCTLEYIEHISGTSFDRLTDLTVNPATNMLYWSGAYGGTRVVSGNTGETIDTLPIYTVKSVLDPQTNRLYFSTYEGVAVVDGRTNEIILEEVSGAQEGIIGMGLLGGCPANCPCCCGGGGEECPPGGRLFTGAGGMVSGLVDIASGAITEIAGAESIIAVAVDRQAREAYLLSNTGQLLRAGENGEVADSVAFGAGTTDIALDEGGRRLYIASQSTDAIFVLDADAFGTSLDTFATSAPPFGLALNPALGYLYYTSEAAGTVVRVNLADGAGEISQTTGAFPQYPAVNPLTGKVYVPNEGDGTVSVYDEDLNPISTEQVEGHPTHAAVSPVTNRVYVVTGDRQSLAVIDGDSDFVTAVIALGADALALAVDPVRNLIYVLAPAEIIMIDGAANTVERRFPSGGEGEDFFALALLEAPCEAGSAQTPFNLLSAMYLTPQTGTGPVAFGTPQLRIGARMNQSDDFTFEALEDGIYELNYHLESYYSSAYTAAFFLSVSGVPEDATRSSAVNADMAGAPSGSGALTYLRLQAGDTVQLHNAAGGAYLANAYISLRKVSG